MMLSTVVATMLPYRPPRTGTRYSAMMMNQDVNDALWMLGCMSTVDLVLRGPIVRPESTVGGG